MKLLVLGHKGMLGRTVAKYFESLPGYELVTLTSRWGDPTFGEEISSLSPDFIVNAIGKIPQKKPIDSEYTFLNVELPRALETLGIPVVHPSTDCEFRGDIAPGEAYTKTSLRDADDVYGMSKSTISKEIEETFKNTKIIRTSIIGHEENSTLALLDWFLSQTGSTRGYTNHFWNGITTLQWAKQCQKLIENWGEYPTLNQFATEKQYSKFDILTIAKAVYDKDIEIIPFETEIAVNKCLTSDTIIPELKQQLSELRAVYGK